MNGKEFLEAVKTVEKEKGISKEEIFEYMEQALTAAYKKEYGIQNSKVVINKDTGDIKVYSYLVVVEDYIDGEEVVDEEGNITYTEPSINEDAQILLEDARKIVPDINIGETIETEVTPADFGRVAASTAKQVLTQKIREAERNSIIAEYADKQDELMVGILAMEDNKNYYVDLGRARGILPKSEMIPGEVVKMGNSIRVYISKIEATPKGPLILCTRKHFGFVKRLFESEIPEFKDGTLVLYGVAREPGVRSKVAVYSTNPHVDAIGTCIGERGSRIGSILGELNGEKVDLVVYDEDPKVVIVSIVEDEKEHVALAVVNNDNLSLAIGKKGINIKLASKLTKFRINIKTMEELEKEGNSDEK